MFYVGIDIGGMNIKMGIVDQKGNVLASNAIKTDSQKHYGLICDDMVSNIKYLCGKLNIDFSQLEGIGIGVPGVADSKLGVVTAAANIGWYGVELAKEMTQRTQLVCKVCNDANCAALGELCFGSGQNYSSLVFITLGTGIGSGIIINNTMLEGEGSAGAESGHITIVYNGEQCNCGKKGCWERYASATALMMQTTQAIEANPNSILADLFKKQGKVSGRTAFEASSMGCPIAAKVVDQYIEYIAAGIISIGNILHPQAFIIGGGISHEGETLMVPLKKKVDAYIELSNFYPYMDIVKASLGNTAGMLGAASLIMRK